MARDMLDEAKLKESLANLAGWTLASDGTSIEKTFEFKNFSEAFAFMTRSALAAEKMDHHPDWSNSYKTVKVALSTHDRGGVTELDIELARRMNKYAPG